MLTCNVHDSIVSNDKMSWSLSNFESNSLCKFIFLVWENNDLVISSQRNVDFILPITYLRRKVFWVIRDPVSNHEFKTLFFITEHSNRVIKFTWNKESLFLFWAMTNSPWSWSWHFDWFILLYLNLFLRNWVIIDNICT